MAILLVIGAMDLRAMAVVAAAIAVERLAPAGERAARAIGAVVVAAGLFLIAPQAALMARPRSRSGSHVLPRQGSGRDGSPRGGAS